MSLSRPISPLRTITLVLGLALRRQANQRQSRRAFRSKTDQTTRPGTPAKSGGSRAISIFVLAALFFNGINVGSRSLVELSASARNVDSSPVTIRVSISTHARLLEVEEGFKRAAKESDPVRRNHLQGFWQRRLDEILLPEARRDGFSEEVESRRMQWMRDLFAQKGASAFDASDPRDAWVSSETWPKAPGAESLFSRSLMLIILLWIVLLVCLTLGIGAKDLGQLEWSFEWLYSFPASASSLFASKLLVYSLTNPLAWVLFFPFLIMVFVASGCGFMALPLGLLAAVYLLLLAGSLATILEVMLRKFLSLSQIKNVQALFTTLGSAGLLVIYALGLSKPLRDFLLQHVARVPDFIGLSPFSLPLILGAPSSPAWKMWSAAGGMALSATVFCLFSLVGSQWLTRDGLIIAGGPYQGTRGVRTRGSKPQRFGGAAFYEALLLVRDRNLFVQVVVVPLLIPAFYMLIFSGMLSAVSGNFRHAAAIAFGVGAYSFLNSAMGVLQRENKTLWQLVSFPKSLSSILVRKTLVWAIVGLSYGGLTLLVLSYFNHHLRPSDLGDAFLGLYGILIYAFIAAGIGILATNPLEDEPRRRIKVEFVYLYMFLAGLYGNVVYAPSLWAKLAQIVLSTVLAFALWQKVHDRCPYILDPIAQPPYQLNLADGMIAVIAFFVLQSLYFIFFGAVIDGPKSVSITMAYVLAGLTIVILWLLVMRGQGVTKSVFTLPESKIDKPSMAWSVINGVGWGALAACVAFIYLKGLSLFPAWKIWKHDAQLSSFLTGVDKSIFLIILMVVAAPVVEEFLFRGLIFQGIRRSTGPVLAVLGSAAVFAVVHPPISVVPVFALGVATAISYQRSRTLLAPMITHAVYNASVIFFNKP